MVGAQGYEVRYWSTTSPFPGVPAEEAYVGALITGTSYTIGGLEPDTEYRAVVYYVADGAVLLGTGSPTMRFITLASGAPTQANPTSPVLERVPGASISTDRAMIDEGEDAVFTVTLDPAPASPLAVIVDVGHYGDGSIVAAGELGPRTVTVPTGGSARFTVPTLDNTDPKANGPLYADIVGGDGYRTSLFDSRAVLVINNDDEAAVEVETIAVKQVTDTTATIIWAPIGSDMQWLV